MIGFENVLSERVVVFVRPRFKSTSLTFFNPSCVRLKRSE